MRRASRAHKGKVRMLGVVKYYDFPSTTSAISTTGLFNGLGNIATGTAGNARLGPMIHISKVEYRIQINASLQSTIATADIFNNVRVIIGRCIGPQSLLGVSNFPSVNNFTDVRQEFEVLVDKSWYLQNVSSGLAAAGSAYGPSPTGLWFCGSINYNKDVLYDTGSGATDSYNVPFFYTVSDSTVTPSPTVAAVFRIHFQDVLG